MNKLQFLISIVIVRAIKKSGIHFINHEDMPIIKFVG